MVFTVSSVAAIGCSPSCMSSLSFTLPFVAFTSVTSAAMYFTLKLESICKLSCQSPICSTPPNSPIVGNVSGITLRSFKADCDRRTMSHRPYPYAPMSSLSMLICSSHTQRRPPLLPSPWNWCSPSPWQCGVSRRCPGLSSPSDCGQGWWPGLLWMQWQTV